MTEARSPWAPLGLALLCGHCAVGAAASAALAAGLLTLPTVLGVPLAWVLPPAVMVGGFGLWLRGGRPRRTTGAGVSTGPHTGDSAGSR